MCDCCGAVNDGSEDWTDLHWQNRTATLATKARDEDNYTDNEADICYDCGEWLIQQIKDWKIRRKADTNPTYTPPTEGGENPSAAALREQRYLDPDPLRFLKENP